MPLHLSNSRRYFAYYGLNTQICFYCYQIKCILILVAGILLIYSIFSVVLLHLFDLSTSFTIEDTQPPNHKMSEGGGDLGT